MLCTVEDSSLSRCPMTKNKEKELDWNSSSSLYKHNFVSSVNIIWLSSFLTLPSYQASTIAFISKKKKKKKRTSREKYFMDFSVLLILHKWKLVIKQLHFLLVQFTVVRLYLCGSVSFWMCGDYKNSRQCISSQLHITEGPHQSSHVYLKQKGTPGTENEDFISSKAWN